MVWVVIGWYGVVRMVRVGVDGDDEMMESVDGADDGWKVWMSNSSSR